MSAYVDRKTLMFSLLQCISCIVIFRYLTLLNPEVDVRYFALASYFIFDAFNLIMFPNLINRYYQESKMVTGNHQRAVFYTALIMVIFDFIAGGMTLLVHRTLLFFTQESFILWMTSFMIVGWLGQTVQEPNK